MSAPQEITVTFKSLITYLIAHKDLAISLEFPDRAGFINCRRPGMRDEYFLDVSLQFNDVGQLEKVVFEQGKSLGPNLVLRNGSART